MDPKAPLVSVGFPLYRSRRFLDIVIANIEAIDYPNVEFVVSDRHQLDDALVVLQQKYGADARFRFLAGTDELNWVQHFNLILRHCRGKYAVLMGHDDSYPANYIADLAAALETHPDAVLAFGGVEQISLDGFLPTFPFVPPPIRETGDWSIDDSVRLLTLWHLWVAFRGMVRLTIVESSGLYIRETVRNIRADIYWVFGLSLKGRLCYVPSCHCTKRFHRTSGGANWQFGVRQSLDACRVLGGYFNDYAPSVRKARVVVYLWCLVQGFLPAWLARRMGILARKLMVRR